MSRDHIGGRIFIGGLDHNCDEEVLEKSFSMFGRVVQVMVMRDRETNRSRGFAFMSFEDQSSADEAIRRMHGVEIQGRCVTVRKAEKQAAFADRPRRGGFRGGGRGGGGDRGFSDRYESSSTRGPGEYRRGSFEDYRSDGRDGDLKRDTYGDSHTGYRSGGYDERYTDSGYSRDGHNNSQGNYSSRQSGDYRGYEARRADDGYRYADTRRDDSRYESGPRDGYTDRSYDSQLRGRSRSPIMRSSYRDQSPPRARRLEARREYTPPTSHRSEHMTREYSPPSNRRAPTSRGMSSREYPDTGYRRQSPVDSRKKIRELSPKEYSTKYVSSRGLSPPRERAYAGSRTAGQSRSPTRKSDYAAKRDSGYGRSVRESYVDPAVKEYSARGSNSYNGQDRGSGSRSYHGQSDGASRYTSSTRYRGSPAPDADSRGPKRVSQRSSSPEHRSRRY